MLRLKCCNLININTQESILKNLPQIPSHFEGLPLRNVAPWSFWSVVKVGFRDLRALGTGLRPENRGASIFILISLADYHRI